MLPFNHEILKAKIKQPGRMLHMFSDLFFFHSGAEMKLSRAMNYLETL